MSAENKSILRCVLLVTAVMGSMAFPGKLLGQQASSPKIVTFDVPGAGQTPGTIGCGNGLLTACFGTTPMANNNAGEIVGMYLTDSGVYYGFLRSPDGKITTFTALVRTLRRKISMAPIPTASIRRAQ